MDVGELGVVGDGDHIAEPLTDGRAALGPPVCHGDESTVRQPVEVPREVRSPVAVTDDADLQWLRHAALANVRFGLGRHAPPLAITATKGVFRRIRRSTSMVCFSMYWRSSVRDSSTSTWHRTLTCHRPVSPWGVFSRARCQSLYISTSYGSAGRGPTRLMSPLRTFQSCGSSSMLSFLRTLPTRVTRGSFVSL